MAYSLLHPLAQNSKAKPSRILFMRHPQTVANEARCYSGQTDVGLSELGNTQCSQAIDALIAWKPTQVISSPLSRCKAIAEPVARTFDIDLILDPRITELDFGPLDGKTFDECMAAGLTFPWSQVPGDWPCQDGESLECFNTRIASFLADLRNTTHDTAVICHGGVIRALMAQILGLDDVTLWKLMVPNVSSCTFDMISQEFYLTGFGLSPEQLVQDCKP